MVYPLSIIHLSFLDGWWAETYRPEAGWALGDGEDGDPERDGIEAERLYLLLEEKVVPAFYERNREGIPEFWVSRIGASMAHLAPKIHCEMTSILWQQ